MTRTRFHVGLVTRYGTRVNTLAAQECLRVVSDTYGGLTSYRTDGYWQGQHEPSMVLEALHDGTRLASTKGVCEELAKLAEQTTILWTEEEVQGGFHP